MSIKLIHDDDVAVGTPATIEFYLPSYQTNEVERVVERRPATVVAVVRSRTGEVERVSLRDETGQDVDPWVFARDFGGSDRWFVWDSKVDGWDHMIDRITLKIGENTTYRFEHVRPVIGIRLVDVRPA